MVLYNHRYLLILTDLLVDYKRIPEEEKYRFTYHSLLFELLLSLVELKVLREDTQKRFSSNTQSV